MAGGNCSEYIDALSRAATVEDVHAVCARFSRDHDFEYFIYGARVPTSFTKPYLIYVSGYPTEWRKCYSEEGYINIDPTVTHCLREVTPARWDRFDAAARRDARLGRFFGEARGFGLCSGVSFPIHSAYGESAMLSLAAGVPPAEAERRIDEVMPRAQLFTAFLHESVRRIFASEILPLAQVQLTEREKQCLLWAAEGKTTWETSQILGIAERTVIFHMQNVSTKLKVVNRSQAVARAVSIGLISPQFG